MWYLTTAGRGGTGVPLQCFERVCGPTFGMFDLDHSIMDFEIYRIQYNFIGPLRDLEINLDEAFVAERSAKLHIK